MVQQLGRDPGNSLGIEGDHSLGGEANKKAAKKSSQIRQTKNNTLSFAPPRRITSSLIIIGAQWESSLAARSIKWTAKIKLIGRFLTQSGSK
jgi:hypothetical protein